MSKAGTHRSTDSLCGPPELVTERSQFEPVGTAFERRELEHKVGDNVEDLSTLELGGQEHSLTQRHQPGLAQARIPGALPRCDEMFVLVADVERSLLIAERTLWAQAVRAGEALGE